METLPKDCIHFDEMRGQIEALYYYTSDLFPKVVSIMKEKGKDVLIGREFDISHIFSHPSFPYWECTRETMWSRIHEPTNTAFISEPEWKILMEIQAEKGQ